MLRNRTWVFGPGVGRPEQISALAPMCKPMGTVVGHEAMFAVDTQFVDRVERHLSAHSLSPSASGLVPVGIRGCLVIVTDRDLMVTKRPRLRRTIRSSDVTAVAPLAKSRAWWWCEQDRLKRCTVVHLELGQTGGVTLMSSRPKAAGEMDPIEGLLSALAEQLTHLPAPAEPGGRTDSSAYMRTSASAQRQRSPGQGRQRTTPPAAR